MFMIPVDALFALAYSGRIEKKRNKNGDKLKYKKGKEKKSKSFKNTRK